MEEYVNPFDFNHDEDSRTIYAACCFLFEEAELYWVAGALNLRHQTTDWDYHQMCLFHIFDYTWRYRKSCATYIINREYPFAECELIDKWIKWWIEPLHRKQNCESSVNHLPSYDVMKRYYDNLKPNQKQNQVEIEIVHLMWLLKDEGISEDEFIDEIESLTERIKTLEHYNIQTSQLTVAVIKMAANIVNNKICIDRPSVIDEVLGGVGDVVTGLLDL